MGHADHVALLPGINVGGRNKPAMADLRKVVESLATATRSPTSSGNVDIHQQEHDTAAIAAN